MTVAPEGRKLLRLEARNAQTPIERKPEWIRTRVATGPNFTELNGLVKRTGLATVCEEAGCPNIFECWEDREATFLIGGEQCSRRCDFCQIDTGRPSPLDRDEPRKVAESVQQMGLRYSTITGVARDDLDDGGSWLYAETVRQVHALNPGTGVELLIPDFDGRPDQLDPVFDAAPEVLAHNLETVPRIFRRIRPGFRYERSLDVIRQARAAGLVTKSNLILGMGETPDEVTAAMRDLVDAGCDLLTLTQYLRPTPRHHPVERWVRPEEFVTHRDAAQEMGFLGVMAGPLVRSSYRAGRLYAQAKVARGETLPEGMAELAEEGPARQEVGELLARSHCVPRPRAKWGAWPRSRIPRRRRPPRRPRAQHGVSASARSGRRSRCSAATTRRWCPSWWGRSSSRPSSPSGSACSSVSSGSCCPPASCSASSSL
jgi:lipoyl synthase